MNDDDLDLRARVDRRAEFAKGVTARTGINEALIRELVHAFYDRVRADGMIGPVFADRIKDWGPHLERMCAFWSSVVLMTGRYHGRPMPAHAPLSIAGEHFDRWLELFADTAQSVCPPAAAALFIEKANLIAASLEQGIGNARGLMLGPGERLPAA